MDSGLCHLKAPNSAIRSLKRLLKSVSKNALKLLSTLYPRRHQAASPLNSPPSKTSSKEREETEGMVRELRAVFRYFDADGDGKISWVELKTALNSVGEEVGDNEAREMIKQLDLDGDGCIDEGKFIRFMTEERGADEAEKELVAAFRMFEGITTCGGITAAGLHRMMCRLRVGEGDDGLMSLEHCNFIISQVDLDGDGVVNFHEFKRMMTVEHTRQISPTNFSSH